MSVPCEISTDPARLDTDLTVAWLRSTYWAKDIPRAVVEKSMRHSLCFGAYADGRQVGFGRVITDYATFGYISDVFVVPELRGQGVSKALVSAMMEHPELQELRRFLLVTHDAHALYERYGFRPISDADQYMTIHRPDLYTQMAAAAEPDGLPGGSGAAV